jgi:hypothetical protein
MLDWLQSYEATVWVVLASAAMFFGSLIVIPIVVARMQPDYFLPQPPSPASWRRRHPVTRYILRATKNLAGSVFLIAGIAMLVLPGQGLLTILIGISLLDFPGKRKLELRIVRREPILHAINWIRRKANRKPLVLPN